MHLLLQKIRQYILMSGHQLYYDFIQTQIIVSVNKITKYHYRITYWMRMKLSSSLNQRCGQSLLMLDECVAISLIGNFKKGSTCCMSSSSVTFLGHILGESLQALCQQHLRRSRKIIKALKLINQKTLRVEYKVWINKTSLALSLFILLSVDSNLEP